MEPLCLGERRCVLADSVVQASITLGAVVQPSFGPNGTLKYESNSAATKLHVHASHGLAILQANRE